VNWHVDLRTCGRWRLFRRWTLAVGQYAWFDWVGLTWTGLDSIFIKRCSFGWWFSFYFLTV